MPHPKYNSSHKTTSTYPTTATTATNAPVTSTTATTATITTITATTCILLVSICVFPLVSCSEGWGHKSYRARRINQK